MEAKNLSLRCEFGELKSEREREKEEEERKKGDESYIHSGNRRDRNDRILR
uniref:Uncharacterized protein n=1 Tax=Cucumis melo TaxID=3656 RepID=A0A9I9CL93_CUCME